MSAGSCCPSPTPGIRMNIGYCKQFPLADDQIIASHPDRRATARRLRWHLPNEAAIIRLIGAVLLEQNDEWQLEHRYMQVEAMTDLVAPASAVDPRQIPCAA
jgi:hypothetical protein